VDFDIYSSESEPELDNVHVQLAPPASSSAFVEVGPSTAEIEFQSSEEVNDAMKDPPRMDPRHWISPDEQAHMLIRDPEAFKGLGMLSGLIVFVYQKNAGLCTVVLA
jgi:hypothetical protein